jgi:hypothetical protein
VGKQNGLGRIPTGSLSGVPWRFTGRFPVGIPTGSLSGVPGRFTRRIPWRFTAGIPVGSPSGSLSGVQSCLPSSILSLHVLPWRLFADIQAFPSHERMS